MINSELQDDGFPSDPFHGAEFEIVLRFEELRDKLACEQILEDPPERFFLPIETTLSELLQGMVAGAYSFSTFGDKPLVSEGNDDPLAVRIFGLEFNVRVRSKNYKAMASLIESERFCRDACAGINRELKTALSPYMKGNVSIRSEATSFGAG